MITQADIQNIEQYLTPILGKKSWGAALGHGSFITIEFGESMSSNRQQRYRGEWHLWVYCCVWYLEKNGEFLVASEDSRSKLETAIQYLDNRVLNSVKLLPPAFETIFNFDEGVILHLFPVYSEEYEHWKLYTPDGNVLVIGPGTNWSYENASAVPSKDT